MKLSFARVLAVAAAVLATTVLATPLINFPAVDGGRFTCYVDGVAQEGTHTQESTASARLANLKLNNPDADVYCSQTRTLRAVLTAAGREFVRAANAAVIVTAPPASGGSGAVIVSANSVSIVQTPGDTPSASAEALFEYRESGGSYTTGVTPSFISGDVYAAAWDLTPGTDYDYRLTYTDAGQPLDGAVETGSFTTRALAAETSGSAADYSVTDESGLTTALSSATAGEIIEVSGTISLTSIATTGNSGTAANPIYLRGDGTGELSYTGETLKILHNHWVIEDIAINGGTATSAYTVRIDGRKVGADVSRSPVTGITIRRATITGKRGVRAWEGGTDTEVYDVTIYDSTFVGPWSWANVVSKKNGGTINDTWDDVGAKMTGQGHSLFHNTFSGFGDAIKTDRETFIDNAGIAYIRNDILWGGDDGIEMDDADYNCVAFENRISNTATAVSKQPNLSPTGPNYIVANVGVNQYLRPLKFNDGPTRVRAHHNTFVNTLSFNTSGSVDYHWLQNNNGTLTSLEFLNNLLVRADTVPASFQQIRFDAALTTPQWDGNAYYPDGEFEFNFYAADANFAAAQGAVDQPSGYDGANFEASGELLAAQPFVSGVGDFGADWETQVTGFDPSISGDATTGAISLPGYSVAYRGAIDGSNVPEYGERDFPSWYPAVGEVVEIDSGTTIGSAARAAGAASYGGSDPDGLAKSWSGGALVDVGGQPYLVVSGGGHGDSSFNGSLKFGPLYGAGSNLPTWTTFLAPSGTGDVQEGPVYADGRQAATHTYNDMVGVGSTLYVMASNAYWQIGNSSARAFSFTPSGQTELANTNNYGILGASTHYNGNIYRAARSSGWTEVSTYSISGDTWTSDPNASFYFSPSLYLSIAADTSRGALLVVGGDDAGYYDDVTDLTSFVDGRNLPANYAEALLYDPGRDAFVSYQDNSLTVRELDAASLAAGSNPSWTTRTFTGDTPAVGTANGIYNRFLYVLSLKGYIVVPGDETHVYFFRSE